MTIKSKRYSLIECLSNPSAIWLAYVPLLGLGVISTALPLLGGAAIAILALFILTILVIRPPFSRLHAVLPTIMMVVIAISLLHYQVVKEEHISALLMGLTALAALWGLCSVGKCPARSHPVCEEHKYSSMLMLGLSLLFLIIDIPLSYLVKDQTTLIIPQRYIALLCPIGTYLLHTIRLSRQDKRSSGTEEYSRQVPLPLIRIAIISGQEIQLTRQKDGALDYPLQTALQKGESKDEALYRLCVKHHITTPPKLLLRYFSNHNEGEQLVYLYILNTPKEDIVESRGTLFSASQIEEEMVTQKIPTLLVEEFLYLKNTILLTNAILQNQK